MESITHRSSAHDRYRDKLSNAGILTRLLLHFHGKLKPPLDNGQINIGLRCLNKILPDLTSVTVDIAIEHHDLNRLQLEGRLNALGINADKIWNQLNPNVIEHVSESESVEDTLIEGTTPLDDESES